MIRTKPSNEQYRKGWERIFQREESADASTEHKPAGVKCYCGSTNTFWVSSGGYQEADASRNMPMIETNGQVACGDCGRTWWD